MYNSVFLWHNSKTVCNMADLSIIVSEIELKLRKLIDEKKQLAVENKRLTEENATLDQENLALRRSVEELQDKINKSTIVNALDNEGEVEEGRKLIKEINITLLDRPYRLSVARADEEKVRKAGNLINERIKYYSKHYAYKDVQDLLSMTALQFATSVVKMDTELTYRNQNLERKLEDLNNLLSEQS